MKKLSLFPFMAVIYLCILGITVFLAVAGERAITVVIENTQIPNRRCVIIDAGHGGVDGGATSYTGVLESNINLEIALRLNDLMHLLGIKTKMIRYTDISIHTQGNSIAQKKVSDLKERVRIVNETDKAILVSIHQNHYSDSRYSGAQVFYPRTKGSDQLAKQLQAMLIKYLNPGSHRQAKKADGIYLMQNINCTGVLVECGFLSNPQEEANLRKGEYQKKLSCIIASAINLYINHNTIA